MSFEWHVTVNEYNYCSVKSHTMSFEWHVTVNSIINVVSQRAGFSSNLKMFKEIGNSN